MKDCIDRLKDLLEWSDRLGSDERDEIVSIIIKLERLKYIDNIKQFKKLIDNHIEYLETSERDEYPSITIENLEGILKRYFNAKK